MSRLWDKGSQLDERVLRYTAGEDHALDNRLVAYDVRASIAHAEMLHAQGLLAADDLGAITRALHEIAAEHARGEWRVRLEHEDGQTALENLLVARIGDTVDTVIRASGVRPERIESVYLTGGASAMRALTSCIAQRLPAARITSGDTFGSIGVGLAVVAARRYGAVSR